MFAPSALSYIALLALFSFLLPASSFLFASQIPKSGKSHFSLLPAGLQRNPQTDFTIVTETTAEGRKLKPPTPDKPVYYITYSVGRRDVGDGCGGTKEIPFQKLENQCAAALAANNYRPADKQHSPTQIFFIVWGMHNKIEPLPRELRAANVDSGAFGASRLEYTTTRDDIRNLLSRAKTVGGQKFADEFARVLTEELAWPGGGLSAQGDRIDSPLRHFRERDERTGTLVDEIFEDCYYLSVTSYDIATLKRGDKKILWSTRISTVALG